MSWIKLYRSLLNSPLWQDKPFARGQAWVDLLLLTNGIERQELKKGRIVCYERGKIYFSLPKLADRWGWSVKKTRCFLKLLESENMLAVKGHTEGTTATVINWEFYQDEGHTKGHTQGTPKGTPRAQQRSEKGHTEGTALTLVNSGFGQDEGHTKGHTEGTPRELPGARRGYTTKNVTENVENVKNVKDPTTQQTTGMVVGTAGAGEVSRCVGGEASAVPSALDAEVAENRYRYGEAIALYDKIKGAPMSPTELDRLTDMVDEYGVDWVLDALRITGQTEGCRSRIGYTQGILRNWQQNGRDIAPTVMSQEERLAAIVRAMEEAERNG